MCVYYCTDCMVRERLIAPVNLTGLAANSYQLDKFIKHTTPTSFFSVNSVFTTTSWNEYKIYMVTTCASGCLEVDASGRKNLLFFAGKETGLKYEQGMYTTSCSGIKLVLSEVEAKVHAYPIDFAPESRTCQTCGKPVPYDY